MEPFDTNVGKMETQLRQWGAKLDQLVAKAEDAKTEAKAEAKSEYRKRVSELKVKHQAAQVKLDELKAGGSDKWETFKTGVEGAWKELEDAFKKLTD